MATKRSAGTKGIVTPHTTLLEIHVKNMIAQNYREKMANTVATGNQGPGNLQAHVRANTESTITIQTLQQEAERHLHLNPNGKYRDKRLPLQTKSARSHRPEMQLRRKTANSRPRLLQCRKHITLRNQELGQFSGH